MKVTWSLLLILLGLVISPPAGAQADVTLIVKTDLSCNWKLDGRPMGAIRDHDLNAVQVSPGEHFIEASTTDGVATIRTKVVIERDEKTVSIQLKDQIDLQSKMQAKRLREQSGSDQLIWTDPATGLIWARKDNGSDLDWNQATAYCSKSRLAGFDDWRLPSIEELQGISDPSAKRRVRFDNGVTYNLLVKGNLQLAGWDWSSTLEDHPSERGWMQRAWQFSFGDAQKPGLFALTFNFSMRALCVRGPAE
jgi:hypothetical protein